jgi:hypothetical protein
MDLKSNLTLGASAATILTFVGLVIRSAFRRRNPEPSATPVVWGKGYTPAYPLDIEVVPIFFDLTLDSTPPRIEVLGQCTNYQNKSLSSLAGEIFQLYLSGANPAIENIPIAGPLDVPSRRSKLLRFTRVLGALEVDAIRKSFTPDGRFTATMRLRVTGKVGRREVEFLPHAPLSLGGWVSGLKERVAAPASPTIVALTADEEQVMHLFASNDCLTLEVHSESHRDAGLSEVRYEDAVQRLIERKFLTRRPASIATHMFPQLTLTKEGRGSLIGRGLV